MAMSLADIVTPRHISITAIPLLGFAVLCIAGIVACGIDMLRAYRDMEELQRENEE